MAEVRVEREGNRIIVHFPYSAEAVQAMRTIPGRRWLKEREGKPWSVPLDMTVCRLLRKGYGDALRIGPELREWARHAIADEERLGNISAAVSGRLERLPKRLPTLYRALYLGPLGRIAKEQLGYTEQDLDYAASLFSAVTGVDYWDGEHGSYQTADVRFLADSPAPLNANHQGLGKTLEAIAEVWEAGRELGNHLVICPKGAIKTVWEPELLRWQADAPVGVSVHACTGTKEQKTAALMEFTLSTAEVKWLVVNPEAIRYEKDEWCESPIAFRAKPKEWDNACKCDRLVDPHWHYQTRFPIIGNTEWDSVINDEVHKGNIRNHRSLTSHSVHGLRIAQGGKPVAQSGTPMKKKGADIWGILNYLRRDVFTSYWNFAEMFFEIHENDYGKTVGKLREDREQDFYRYLTPYVLRRTKKECLPWLPDKLHVPIWVELEGKQRTQYEQMEQDFCAWLEDSEISAPSVIAQYTRLQQFAGAYCEMRNGEVVPTLFSAKLDALWERLAEAGILDGSSEDQTLIFSQSRKMVELVHWHLRHKLDVKSEIISGKRTVHRESKVARFQDGTTKVMCVVTTAGGVALTLDAADTAHFLDESWAPDDQEQAEDRIHRASRMHQVLIYHYRARNTIDEDKMAEALDKSTEHERILDLRRKTLERNHQ